MDNVVELHPETVKTASPIKVSKVYVKGTVKPDGSNDWAFNITIGDNDPVGYAFKEYRDAVKGRVLMQKKLKSEGFKIHCQS